MSSSYVAECNTSCSMLPSDIFLKEILMRHVKQIEDDVVVHYETLHPLV